MKKRSILLFFVLILITGCGSYNKIKKNNPVFEDNLSIYTDYNDPKLIEWRVDIPLPNSYLCSPWYDISAPPRPCTLDDVLHDINPYDDYKPKIHVDIASDYPIPFSGTGLMYQKGKTTRHAKNEKSFRIKLDKNSPFYEGQRVLQLNKHPYDYSRVRNKLFFDMFVGIPHFCSLRTNFSHLKVKADENNTDFGLFTHVEQVDKYYLKNHALEDGKIYKAQSFDFRYESTLAVDKEGRPLDPEAFEKIIEPKKGKNHKKLIEMIKAIDEAPTGNGFMTIFNKYFDYENYITWMAVNYVVCNADTINQNFFLYNPEESDKFFFIPWDYDDASPEYKLPKWQLGFGRYWDIPLHRKFLSIDKNREAVINKVDEIYKNYINSYTVSERLKLYRPIVEPIITSPPDSENLPYKIWESSFTGLPKHIDENVQLFKKELGSPMPYWEDYKYEGTLIIIWKRAVDFNHNPVVYDIKVAKDPEMNNTIIEFTDLSEEDLHITSWGEINFDTKKSLEPGVYYLKVVAKVKDHPSYYQIAMDDCYVNHKTYYGVRKIEIK